MDTGIVFGATGHEDGLTIFTDSDWAGDRVDRKSIGGILMNFGGPIFWKSSKQTIIALSSAEAEYVSVFEAAKQVAGFQNLLKEINIKVSATIKCDNKAAIAQASAPTISPKSRHIELRMFYLKDQVEQKFIVLKLFGYAD